MLFAVLLSIKMVFALSFSLLSFSLLYSDRLKDGLAILAKCLMKHL